jgi:hypothetical protein
MALPTQSDLLGLDFGHYDGAFAQVASKSTTNLDTLDFAYLNGPFAGNPSSTSFEFTTSGSVVFSGSAIVPVEASGGVILGSSAPAQLVFEVETSGNVELNGDADAVNSAIETGGGMIIGESASSGITFTYIASGKLTLNGTALSNFIQVSGRLVLGDSATAQLIISEFSFTAEGKMVLGSSANATLKLSDEASGKLTLADAADTTLVISFAPAGNLFLGNSAQLELSITYAASGVVRLSNSVIAELSLPVDASGKLILSDSASFATSLSFNAAGRMLLGDTAELTSNYSFASSGAVLISGAALTPHVAEGRVVLGSQATAGSSQFQLLYSVTTALAGNTDPQPDPDSSLGKFISTTIWIGGVENDLFDIGLISPDLPSKDYRCIFIKNTLSDTMYDVVAHINSQTSGGADIEIGADPTAETSIGSSSSQAVTIVSETTAPLGVTFSPALTRASGISLGTIPPFHCKAFWFRRTVNTALDNDDFEVCVTALKSPRILEYAPSGGLLTS